MSHNNDPDLLAGELAKTLNQESVSPPDGISYVALVNLTIDFFTTQPCLKEKLNSMMSLTSIQASHSLLSPTTGQMEVKPRRRMSRIESLKPVLIMLENQL